MNAANEYVAGFESFERITRPGHDARTTTVGFATDPDAAENVGLGRSRICHKVAHDRRRLACHGRRKCVEGRRSPMCTQ